MRKVPTRVLVINLVLVLAIAGGGFWGYSTLHPKAAPVALHASNDALAPVLDDDAHGPAAEGISAGVDRVGQDVMKGRIYRSSPDDPIRRVADGQDG